MKFRGSAKLKPFLNPALYSIGNIAPQLINVALLPLFTRFLSREEYGIFGYITALSAFLALIGNFSIHSYALRHYFECKNSAEVRRMFGSMFIFLCLYNGILLAAELILLPPLFRATKISIPFDPYMRLALIGIAIENLIVIPLAYFRVREEAGRFISFTLAQTIINLGISFYFVVALGAGLIGRYYGQLGADVLMLVPALWIMIKISDFSLDPGTVNKALKFSMPLALTGFFYVMFTMLDRLVLERYVSLVELGIYTVGFSIAYGLNSVSNGIYKALEPVIYKLANDRAFDEKIVRLKNHLVFILISLGAVFIVFSREIVMIFAASKFYESYKIAALLSVRVIIVGISIPVTTYLVAINKTHMVPILELLCAIASSIFLFLLIPYFGMYGAAISGIISALLIIGAYAVLTERIHGIRWRHGKDLMVMSGIFLISGTILRMISFNFVFDVAAKSLLLCGVIILCRWWLTGSTSFLSNARTIYAFCRGK
jgi:O-antigen/teichoic acid export membrane protein